MQATAMPMSPGAPRLATRYCRRLASRSQPLARKTQNDKRVCTLISRGSPIFTCSALPLLEE